MNTKLHALAASLATLCATPAMANLTDLTGLFQSELEERAALSNQTVYDELKAQGCSDTERTSDAFCTGTTFIVWKNVRELVHTANELTGNGPTQYSLDTDLEGLGFALRWTAGEEFSSQESMTDSFTGGQLSSLSNRITAVRSGVRGFTLNGLSANNDEQLAAVQPQSGLSAGDPANSADAAWSRWGGFLNGSYSYGDESPTQRENAYDFDGREVSAGLDYRVNAQWVVGGLVGYQDQEVDFDSSQSIVDGGVLMDGWSLMPFVLYQRDDWYATASTGLQSMEFTTERSIRYPSLNPNVPSVNTVATSSNRARTLTGSISGGYSYRITDTWTLEPSLSINYQRTSINAYTEQDIKDDGFNFIVDKQSIKSLESVFGLKLQYLLNSQYGVFMPFIDAQFYAQHETDERYINATYANASNVISDSARFSLPTNTPDSDYKIYGLGVAAVLRGASQATLDAPASGGIQGFIQLRQVVDVGNFSQRMITGGLRYEF